MIGIYVIQNIITKRVYVGKSINIDKRLNIHFRDLSTNRHYNSYLQRAYNKYTRSNFNSFIIEECLESELNNREKYWISYYRNKHLSYNIALGGEGGKMPSEIIEANKIKISKANKGNPKLSHKGKTNGMYNKSHSLETKQLISKKLKGNKPWNLNKPCSTETKNKISNTLKGRKLSQEVCKNISKGHLGLKYKRNIWTDEICSYIRDLHLRGLSFYKLGHLLGKNAETIRLSIRKFERENNLKRS